MSTVKDGSQDTRANGSLHFQNRLQPFLECGKQRINLRRSNSQLEDSQKYNLPKNLKDYHDACLKNAIEYYPRAPQ